MENRRCMKCMHALAAGETFCSECGRPYGSVETERFALKPGTILDGKYLVGEMLGQGGFGITYIGFDLLLEQKVAIKEYYPMSTGMVSRENSTTVVWSSAVMQKSGMGQLIFTSHKLYPLVTLESNSIVFTTTNPSARYTRIKSVRATNNLRSMYMREVILGSDHDVSL